MKITKLASKEQFERLKPKDKLIVQWKVNPNSGKKHEEITMTKIWGINSINEVIVRKRDNLYFSVENILNGTSCAVEAYLVEMDIGI